MGCVPTNDLLERWVQPDGKSINIYLFPADIGFAILIDILRRVETSSVFPLNVH